MKRVIREKIYFFDQYNLEKLKTCKYFLHFVIFEKI